MASRDCQLSAVMTICPLSGQSRCEFSPQTRGQYLIYTDKSAPAFTDSQCRQACSQEREFNCRSVQSSNVALVALTLQHQVLLLPARDAGR